MQSNQQQQEGGMGAAGRTNEEALQNQIAGDAVLLVFQREDQVGKGPFWEQQFKEGVTFEWVKNKVAEQLEANYEDLSLFVNDKRIPEPFCLVDMGLKGTVNIVVKIAEGAVLGNDALREQVLKEIAEQEAAE